jgi:hypothetical protein
MGWWDTIANGWKGLLCSKPKEPGEGLRTEELGLHCLLKTTSWVLVGFSFFSYVAMAVGTCLMMVTSSSELSLKFAFFAHALFIVFAVIFLLVALPCIIKRVQLEREILQRKAAPPPAKGGHEAPADRPLGGADPPRDNKNNDLPRDSIWDAFPFAALVFFLVAVFMLFDVAYGSTTDTAEKMLLKLALYLVAALVTSIVVLFGAHLVRFEGAVTSLTDKTRVAAGAAQSAAGAAGQAASLSQGVAEEFREVRDSFNASLGSLDAATKSARP